MGKYIARISYQFIAVLFAMTFLGHGGQLHLEFSEGETVSIMMCGTGSHRMVEMTFGEDVPPTDTKSECCGDCTVHYDAMMPMGRDVSHKIDLPLPVLLAHEGAPIHPGGPLWPGAPPIGPPHLI